MNSLVVLHCQLEVCECDCDEGCDDDKDDVHDEEDGPDDVDLSRGGGKGEGGIKRTQSYL